jgi:hypothetical protein
MQAMVYGYARVSSREQNEARQMIALHGFGVQDKNIYLDRQSGKDFNRPQYKKLMRRRRQEVSASAQHPSSDRSSFRSMPSNGKTVKSPHAKRQSKSVYLIRPF